MGMEYDSERQLHIVQTWEEVISHQSPIECLRMTARDFAIFSLSLNRSIAHSRNWIRFPYYHHVFEDERHGFARQMDYLKNFGDFISLDQAIFLLDEGKPIDGRYFCITFDDGIKCCYDGAVPILVERDIPAAFFIVTDYTALSPDDRVRHPLHKGSCYAFEYLTWPECCEMIEAGMTIGSHTCSHVRLIDLEADDVRSQMQESKRAIEEKIGMECKHFACPWGGAGKDFQPRRDVDIAKEIGYKSFLTTRRGKNEKGCSSFAIKRDNMFANWGNYQLRYFLSL